MRMRGLVGIRNINFAIAKIASLNAFMLASSGLQMLCPMQEAQRKEPTDLVKHA